MTLTSIDYLSWLDSRVCLAIYPSYFKILIAYLEVAWVYIVALVYRFVRQEYTV